jgi:hypothetical protein
VSGKGREGSEIMSRLEEDEEDERDRWSTVSV